MTMTAFDWTSVAVGWDRHRGHVEAMKQPATEALLHALRIAEGETVVELGAGTGELSRRIAGIVGPGRVVASDVADGMVGLLSGTCAGLGNVEVRRLDATDVDLPDGSADAVVFRMGLMLLTEPDVALREIRRVLRPGGRAGIVVWAAPEHNPWMVAVGMAAMMHGLASVPPVAPGMPFSLAEPSKLRGLLVDAGFVDVAIQEVETPSTYADAREHFDTVTALACPLGAAISAAPPEQVAAMRATAAEVVGRYRTDAGLVVPGRTLVAVASVP